ncbi:hypothetical protein LTR29_009720 [Friedmanniomyces endolithicus]|nr:hypothetical protein LTR29_009720 [Friedmanniomyces endolithicus]
MNDAEKALAVPPPAAAVAPVKAETELEKPTSNDAASSEAADDKLEKEKASLKDFFRIFTYADRLDILLYSIGLGGGVAVGAALPLMTLVFGSSTAAFNNVATGQNSAQQFTARINHLVLYFVYLFVARFVIGYIATLCICIAATRTTRALRKAFLDSLLRQEVWYFDREGNGSPATQVTTNGNRVNQGIAEKLYTLVQGISLFFSAYAVALAIQWKLALIVMSIVPAIFGVVGACISVLVPIEARTTRIYSRAAVLAQDALSSIKTIHAFGAQSKIVNKYDEFLEEAHQESKKLSVFFGILFSGQTFFVMSGTALAFWQGYRMFRSGEIASVGTVFTVVLSVTLGSTSIMLIFPNIQAITNATSAANELFSVIDKPSELDPLSPEGARPASCSGDVQIRDLRFAYPSRPTAQVLQGLTLSIPAGKTTALVGPSGCGKSTLIGLLERWYQPASGQILLDGHDVAEYNTSWLRSNIRLVQQEPVLFQGTIFQNVAKGFVGEQQKLPEDA